MFKVGKIEGIVIRNLTSDDRDIIHIKVFVAEYFRNRAPLIKVLQYKILQFITPLYEHAKVSLYCLVAHVISLLICICVVVTAELVKKRRAAYPDRFDSLVATFRSDWFGLRLTASDKKGG